MKHINYNLSNKRPEYHYIELQKQLIIIDAEI